MKRQKIKREIELQEIYDAWDLMKVLSQARQQPSADVDRLNRMRKRARKRAYRKNAIYDYQHLTI